MSVSLFLVSLYLMQRQSFLTVLLAVTVLVATPAQPARAQESLSLVIEPSRLEISIAPGETWNAEFVIANPNSYPVTLHAAVADFDPQGEMGVGRLVPPTEDLESVTYSASRWVTFGKPSFAIEAEQSTTLPISLAVPEVAEPGTHVAALIVGTRAGEEVGQLGVSANVTSLLLVKVLGDVTRDGFIREFVTSQRTYNGSDVDFTVRFENAGNTHLTPRGEVVITNIWGRERGRIPVNAATAFDIVLPKRVGDFSFTWSGSENAFDIGPYRATLTMSSEARSASGGADEEDGNETVFTASTFFWIIPWGPLVLVGSILLLFFAAVALVTRMIVRRVTMREAMMHGGRPFGAIPPSAMPVGRRLAVVDLRQAANQQPTTNNQQQNGVGIMRKLTVQWRMIGIVVSVLGFLGAGAYLWGALQPDRDYEVRIQTAEEERVVAGGDLAQLPEPTAPGTQVLEQPPLAGGGAEVVYDVRVLVQNGSGRAGKAGEIAERLKAAGFTVVDAGNADSFDYERTVVRYHPGRGSVAEDVVRLIGGDPVVEEVAALTADVVVIIGQDL